MEDLKYRLEPQAFEKLKGIVKQNTNINNLTKENIEVNKKAIEMLITWITDVYLLDRKEIVNDEVDLDKLFTIKS